MKPGNQDSGKPTRTPARGKDEPNIQGEGDYESAREYNKDLKEFVKSGKVDEAARAAKPGSDAEAADMKRAEEIGKSRAKEEDRLLNKRQP